MKERPILFNDEMVRAILDGRKTQTRRVIKPQPEDRIELQTNSKGDHFADDFENNLMYFKCPYGIHGDRLIPAMEIPSLNRNYCADIYGGIWSRARDGVTWKRLKPSLTSKSYLCVTPSHNGKYTTLLVHRLVAEAFYGVAPDGLKQVRHLDGNQENNAPENLDWGTQEDNWSDRLTHGKSLGEDHHNSKLKQWQVDEILRSHKPQRSLASEFGVSQATIWSVKNGKYWQKDPQPNPPNCPRWASRILLEVTSIRVERVQDISEPDALVEGVKSTAVVNEAGDDYTGSYASEHYIGLWNSIYEKKGFGWDMNPWCWCVSFKVIKP